MQSLAFVSDGKLLDTMTYELDGTPCGNVSEKSQCLYNGDVQSKFPKDVYLKENDIKSYLGVSLVDMNGSPLGIMSIMDTKLLDENEIENMQSTLRAFAARVEAEMRRIKVENKMQHYAN
ncbi:MAG: GAF domain-containing protein, partial [Nitrospina sp.]|nr:GAF domain-containing protein [Nitrospina sp.]